MTKPRRAVRRVPVFHKIADGRVGNRIVASARPADIGNLIRIIAILQAFDEVFDKLGRHVAVAVRHRVAPKGNPDQHLALTVGADPPERSVFPLHQNVANAVEVVRCDGEVPDARLGHRRDRAPRIAGDVADHRRVHGHARAFTELSREAKQPHQFLWPAEARQFVQIHSVEGDLAASDRVEKLFTLAWRRDAARTDPRPKPLPRSRRNRAPAG